MPQVIGLILAIIIAAWVVAVVVWIVQWIAAGCVWAFEVALYPTFVYFLPATLAALGLAGVFWGSGIAARNYVSSLNHNLKPEESSGKIYRTLIIGFLSTGLLISYAGLTYPTIFFIKDSTISFVTYINNYYDRIIFPAFRITFPFWD